MLKFASTDRNPLQIDVELQPPGLYLDYGVIADLAKDMPARGAKVRDLLLGAGGTLYLSWAHLLELFSLGKGPTYDIIRNYLASYGRHFVMIDCHAQGVITRERNRQPGSQNPAVDEDFLGLIGQEWDGISEVNVAILLDFMMRDPKLPEKYQGMHREHKEQVKETFDAARLKYKQDRGYRRDLTRAEYTYNPPGPPTESIYYEVMRECIRTNEVFNESDGLDFEHAVVSLSYCAIVVLDKKWARRIRKIRLPKAAAVVFNGTEVDALEVTLQGWGVIREVALGSPNQTAPSH